MEVTCTVIKYCKLHYLENTALF